MPTHAAAVTTGTLSTVAARLALGGITTLGLTERLRRGQRRRQGGRQASAVERHTFRRHTVTQDDTAHGWPAIRGVKLLHVPPLGTFWTLADLISAAEQARRRASHTSKHEKQQTGRVRTAGAGLPSRTGWGFPLPIRTASARQGA